MGTTQFMTGRIRPESARRICRIRRLAGRPLLAVTLLLGLALTALAQSEPNHYFHSADMPPGSIGWGQLQRSPSMRGYYQSVVLRAPKGTQIALAVDGLFDHPQPSPLKVGLLVGHVYRLKVTNIPLFEGREVFPSVEIINRLHAPAGQETRFPIPVYLTSEELSLALRGQFVTRVIYVEDPQAALPRREQPDFQRYFDVGPQQDPLKVADRIGRPVAILRIGSRVPELDRPTGRFTFQSPPWRRYESPAEPSKLGDPAQINGDRSARVGQPTATVAGPSDRNPGVER